MQWLFKVTVLRTILLAAVVLFFFFSPYDLRQMARARRIVKTGESSTPLEIALVWPKENGHSFVEGALLAVRQINERGGVAIANENGDLVRVPLKVAEICDEDVGPGVERVARRIARNKNLTAVIGYSQPDNAIRASVTYQDFGVLYFSPSVSDPQLSLHGFWSTFRTIPDDGQINDSVVHFALQSGCRSPAILYVRNSYGSLYERLLREGIGKFVLTGDRASTNPAVMKLAYEGYYSENQQSFYLLISDLLDQKFDVVFVGDSLIGESAPRTLALIQQLREMGVKQPIMGPEELHSRLLWETLKEQANNTFAPTMYDLHSSRTNEAVRQFYDGFLALYGDTPTMYAGEAYEAVELLAQAAERAKSKVPIKIAIMLKSTPHWDGLQGKGAYSFSTDGGIQGKRLFVEQMKDGVYISPELPSYDIVFTNKFESPEKKQRR